MLLGNPAFTILVALSLALGIGANPAIYSFMDALLMRSCGRVTFGQSCFRSIRGAPLKAAAPGSQTS
jgi:hypothetical protein